MARDELVDNLLVQVLAAVELRGGLAVLQTFRRQSVRRVVHGGAPLLARHLQSHVVSEETQLAVRLGALDGGSGLLFQYFTTTGYSLLKARVGRWCWARRAAR